MTSDHSVKNTFIYVDSPGEILEPAVTETVQNDHLHYECKDRFLVAFFVYANQFHESKCLDVKHLRHKSKI